MAQVIIITKFKFSKKIYIILQISAWLPLEIPDSPPMLVYNVPLH